MRGRPPDPALAEEIRQAEELRDDEVSSLRREGREREADLRGDAWNRHIARLHARARRRAGDTRSRSKRNLSPRQQRATTADAVDAGLRAVEDSSATPPRPPATPSSSPRRRSGGGIAGWARRRGRSEASRAWRQSGVPGATYTWSAIGYRAVGATVGLGLLLVLVRGRGPSAIGAALGALADGVQLVVSPVDPLAPFSGQQLGTFGAAGGDFAPGLGGSTIGGGDWPAPARGAHPGLPGQKRKRHGKGHAVTSGAGRHGPKGATL